MAITRAGLIARLTFPAAHAALRESAEWLHAHGCTPVIEARTAEAAAIRAASAGDVRAGRSEARSARRITRATPIHEINASPTRRPRAP